LEGKAKIFGICNGRPTLLTYFDDERISYRQSNTWFLDEELKDCDFYKSEKNNDVYRMYFFCDPDKISIYDFDIVKNKTKRYEDRNFSDVFIEDFKSVYRNFNNCHYKNHSIIEIEEYPNIISVKLDCQGDTFLVSMTETFHSIYSPILLDENLQDSSETSFYRSFEKTYISDFCDLDCFEVKHEDSQYSFSIKYIYSNKIPISINSFELKNQKIEEIVSLYGEYFIPFIDIQNVECESSSLYDNIYYCNSEQNIILVEKIGNFVSIRGRL
jgi:hypothetical protein